MKRDDDSLILPLIGIVVLGFVPLFAPPFLVYVANEILIAAIFTYGFYFLFSNAGYLSFGQAAYFALGGYSVALVYKFVGSSMWIAFLSAIAVSGITSLILGVLCVRLGKIYFSFLTLAFGQMVYTILYRWRAFTGGDDGLPNVPRGIADFYFFKIPLDSPVSYYYFTFVIFVLVFIVLWRLVNSCFGLSIRSIRENIERAEFVGLNAFRYALITFMISSICCGIAGGLQVSLTKIACPELSYWLTSAEPVNSLLIGGIYSLAGPLVGTAVYILIKTYTMMIFGNWVLILGIILLLVVLFFRQGIVGTLRKVWSEK